MLKSDMFKFKNSLITISMSEICNIKCKFCYHCEKLYDIDGKNVFLEKKDRKFMTFEVFKNIFDNLDYIFDEIDLTGYGEPVINPDIIKILKYCVENSNNRFKKIFISSNALALGNDLSDKIIDIFKNTHIKLHFLFSINASNQQTYYDVCGSNEYFEVEKNVGYFINKVKERKLDNNIFTTVQMVIVKENMNDVKEFHKKWDCFFKSNNLIYDIEKACACGETIVCEQTPNTIAYIVAILANQKTSNQIFEHVIKNARMDFILENDEESTRINADFNEITDFSKRPACSALWKNPIVGVDGDLYICSRDLAGNYSSGNLQDYKFTELFFGKQMTLWRKNHMLGNFRDPGLCFYCGGYEASLIDDEELKEYFSLYDSIDTYYFYKKRIQTDVLFDYRYVEVNSDIFLEKEKKIFTEFFKSEKKYSNIIFMKNKLPDNLNIESTILPCSYLTDYRYFEKDGIYCGCEKNKLKIEDLTGVDEMLAGDNSKLNYKCLNCVDRLKPLKFSFQKNREKLNKYWFEFTYEKEFFEKKLPDFITQEFDNKFLNSEAAKFRESYIRFLLKYDKNTEVLDKLYNNLLECCDPYLYILLLRALLFNRMFSQAKNILFKLQKIYPTDYIKEFALKFDIFLKTGVFDNEISEKYKKEESLFMLFWALGAAD